MTKNVLYISYDGMTDPLGQSQVLPYLVGLSKEEYQFHLISFEKPEKFEKHWAQVQQICDEAGITWYPQKYTRKPPVLSTLRDMIIMRRLAFKLHVHHYFHIVHCRSYIAALVGLRMKKRFDTKFVFDMRGFWADERVDGGIWSLKNPIFKKIYNFFKGKEIEFLENADHIISLTESAKIEMESWKQVKRENLPITVIPCCVDLDLFNPDKISQNALHHLRTTLGIREEDFVLGYVGSIGTWYMLPEMLDYFKVFKLENPNARFLFVTGESKSKLVEAAIEKGIDPRDIIVTSTSHDKVPLHISLFNLSVFFIRPTYSKMASSPTKQGEIMAMGVPLVCNAGVGDTDKIVKDYQAGIVISSFTKETYQKHVKLPIPYDKTSTMKGAKEFFGLVKGVQLYKSCYEKIIE